MDYSRDPAWGESAWKEAEQTDWLTSERSMYTAANSLFRNSSPNTCKADAP